MKGWGTSSSWVIGAWLLGLVVMATYFQPGPATAQQQPTDLIVDDDPAAVAEAEHQAAADAAKSQSQAAAGGFSAANRWALFTLLVGMLTVLGLIIAAKVNAFIALITAAIVVSLMSQGDVQSKISRVASAFGGSAGDIGIVIAMAAVIGKCMLDSGAADRVVRAFLRLFGEKRAPVALMGSGFVLAVPVFFDTVFYLLVPLARSLHRKSGKEYLKYLLAIGAGGAITHTLVPPTPGPLLMADQLNFDVGIMILVGGLVALPAAVAGLVFAGFSNQRNPIPMRQVGGIPDPEPLPDNQLPSLWLALAPVVLPVLLISTNTILTTLADGEHAALLNADDINNFTEFRQEVDAQADASGDSPGGRIVSLLNLGHSDSEAQRKAALAQLESAGDLTDQQQTELVQALNTYVLPRKDFYDEEAFFSVRLNDTAKDLLGKDLVRMKKVDVERMNRALLESAYPDLVKTHVWETPARKWANMSALVGNANLALLISTVIALLVLVRQRGLSRVELAQAVETALMSGGVIILITAGGGAFGAMLKVAAVGDAMQQLFAGAGANSGILMLFLGFFLAALLKVAQGSSTVAMITGSAMLATMVTPETLTFHPVYIATAIGAGSCMGSWMNDSGFWIFAKMGGLTEVETLRTWTIMLAVLGVTSMTVTVILAVVMPLKVVTTGG